MCRTDFRITVVKGDATRRFDHNINHSHDPRYRDGFIPPRKKHPRDDGRMFCGTTSRPRVPIAARYLVRPRNVRLSKVTPCWQLAPIGPSSLVGAALRRYYYRVVFI